MIEFFFVFGMDLFKCFFYVGVKWELIGFVVVFDGIGGKLWNWNVMLCFGYVVELDEVCVFCYLLLDGSKNGFYI